MKRYVRYFNSSLGSLHAPEDIVDQINKYSDNHNSYPVTVSPNSYGGVYVIFETLDKPVTDFRNPCEGCYHWDNGSSCLYFSDENEYDSEEEKFLANCCGCCCGDGCECHRGEGCQNYETEDEIE